MTISNRDFAKNRSFVAAVSFSVCPDCYYTSNHPGLSKIDQPCPNCGAKTIREAFPSSPASKLLEMIAYFYAAACDRLDIAETELIEKLRTVVGREYRPKHAVGVAIELRKEYSKHRESTSDTAQLIALIRERLSLCNDDDANKALYILTLYTDTLEEHKVVVTLTCSLLEKLLYDLLIRIMVFKGWPWLAATEKVDSWQTFPKKSESFELLTGSTLMDAIEECAVKGFFSDWQHIRNKRNDFVHKSPYAIGVKTAEKAFNLAKNTCSVFAYLQNRFCVRPTGKAAQQE